LDNPCGDKHTAGNGWVWPPAFLILQCLPLLESWIKLTQQVQLAEASFCSMISKLVFSLADSSWDLFGMRAEEIRAKAQCILDTSYEKKILAWPMVAPVCSSSLCLPLLLCRLPDNPPPSPPSPCTAGTTPCPSCSALPSDAICTCPAPLRSCSSPACALHVLSGQLGFSGPF